MRRTSELFTGSTAVKLVNEISRHKSYRLVINDSARSNHIELATYQEKIVPPKIFTLQQKFSTIS